jgi:hypothetical protein
VIEFFPLWEGYQLMRALPRLRFGKREIMRKILSLISVLALTFALVSCSKDESPEANATGAAADNTAANAPSAGTPAAAKAPAAKPADAAPKPVAPRTFTVPNGTAITVFLNDPISTGKNKTGETFTARVADPVVVNGETIIERGATVKGKILEAEESGRVKGKANIRMELTSIVAGEKSYPISTGDFSEEAASSTKRDAGLIAGGGGLGAAIGAIAGGGKGAVKGAVIGGAAGTGAVLATKGKEVELGTETKLTFPLQKAAELPKIK